MQNIILSISLILFAGLSFPAGAEADYSYGDSVFDAPLWATAAGAGYYDVTDQTINLWADDGEGTPTSDSTQDNDNVTVIQGPDQNWGGTANIMPGLITYTNLLGAPDYAAGGFGGAASGGTVIVYFENPIVNGTDDVTGKNASGNEINYGPIDFMVHGFGFCFNKAFSAERGTVKIYAAKATYNPTVSSADLNGPGPLGQVTITQGNSAEDESQWVLISEYKGYQNGTWEGNPNMDYTSQPGAYGLFLWGDLNDGGLEETHYLKFVLGDGNHTTDDYTGAEANTGRAFFIDAVEGRGYTAPTNTAPVLNAIGNQNVVEEAELSFSISATDSEADNITYSFTSDPSITGATLDQTTGAFSWTPGSGSTGIYEITFTATDDGQPSMQDSETIEVAVGSVNHPPEFETNKPASTYAILEEQLLSFGVSATDEDGDNISYSFTSYPTITGATFNNVTGIFSWTPGSESAGTYKITITANDDNSSPASASKTVTVTVGPAANNAPEFETDKPAASYTATQGEVLSFKVSATDADGDNITYSFTSYPSITRASLNEITGIFSWTPGSGSTGTYTIWFTATDDSSSPKSAKKAITVTVGGAIVAGGDINGNGTVDLEDAVNVLKILSGETVSPVNLNSDVNDDGKIGIMESIHILKNQAGEK